MTIVTAQYRANYDEIEWKPLPYHADPDEPISKAHISGHLKSALKLMGVDDWRVVMDASDREILTWPNVGKRFLKELRSVQPLKRPTSNVTAYVIRDEMDPVFHPATGQMMDSKSNFRRITRERGLTEVGNETMIPRTPERVSRPGPDIKRAIEELRSR